MTTSAPAAAALVANLSAITCPVDRAEQITQVAGQFGNLPSVLARMRGDALDEARTKLKVEVEYLADRLRISQRQIYAILRQTQLARRNEPSTASVDPTPECAAPPTLPSAAEPLVPARSCKTAGGADLDLTVPTATTDGGQP